MFTQEQINEWREKAELLDDIVAILDTEMGGMSYIQANSCRIIDFQLPDGRLVQAQLILQTDEYEFIGEE